MFTVMPLYRVTVVFAGKKRTYRDFRVRDWSDLEAFLRVVSPDADEIIIHTPRSFTKSVRTPSEPKA